jgi:prolyl-tRNA synthetase
MVDPNAKLEEELIVLLVRLLFGLHIRVGCNLTGFTLINQWANVVRWEMRTRLFFKNCRIYGKKGILLMPQKQRLSKRVRKMMNVYADLLKISWQFQQGIKTETERFAGAEETYCIEALMQDGKALQAGTPTF